MRGGKGDGGGGGGSKKGGNRAFKILKNFFGLSRAGPGGCRKEFVSIICNISERINKALKKKKKKKKLPSHFVIKFTRIIHLASLWTIQLTYYLVRRGMWIQVNKGTSLQLYRPKATGWSIC